MRRHLLSITLLVLLGAACEQAGEPLDPGPGEPPPAAISWAAPAAPAPPAAAAAELSAPGQAGQGSSIVVATLARPAANMADPHGRVVIVADEEGDAVRVLDAASGAALAELAVPGGPTAVVPAPGGRVLAALRRANAVGVLALSEDLTLTEVARADTAEEPVALALAGDRVVVASGFGHALEGFSLDSFQRVFSVDLPREPRSVVVAGGHAFVSHMVGSTVSDVDLGADPPARAGISLAGHDITSFCGCMCSNSFVARAAVQGFAVAVSDGKLWLPLAFSRSGEPAATAGYGGGGSSFPLADAALLSIDLATKDLTYRVDDTVFTGKKLRERTDMFGAAPPRSSAGRCLLPRAVAVLPASKRALVACLGSDEVFEIDGAEKAFVSAPGRAFRVPAGPVGLSVDDARSEVFVWSRFDRAVSVLSLGDTKSAGAAPSKKVDVAAAPERVFNLPSLPAEDAQVALGRKLFHATFDRRISADGRACASCHPDGRDDGLVWSSPKGPLQTPMLAGRLAETAPYGWEGDTRTVGEHLRDTLKRLGGKGLGEPELAALSAYVTTLPGPARRAQAADTSVARGKEIFESMETMCTICHTDGGRGTDGARHDVGSGLPLETPTLRFVAGTAPYFHDGRYATLRDLLRGSSGKMGGSLDGLGDADLDALEAYLRTL